MFFENAELIWARDPEFFIFRKLGLWNILPFEENIPKYDEATLFSIIEFLLDYVYNRDFAGISEFAVEGVVMSMIKSMVKEYIGLW